MKHKFQISTSPEMDPPLKPADEVLLSRVTKDERAAAVKAEEEKLAAKAKKKAEEAE